MREGGNETEKGEAFVNEKLSVTSEVAEQREMQNSDNSRHGEQWMLSLICFSLISDPDSP